MERDKRVTPGEQSRSWGWVCRTVEKALGAVRQKKVMGEESPLLPALWEEGVSVVLLGGEWNQKLSGKGLEPCAARVSFVLVSCLNEPCLLRDCRLAVSPGSTRGPQSGCGCQLASRTDAKDSVPRQTAHKQSGPL